MSQIPFAILSDSPDCQSGFGRIARDLAWLIYTHIPELKVATFGYWGRGSSKFPWAQYQLGEFNQEANISGIPAVWEDFAGGEPGILCTIYDIARLIQLAMPEYIQETSAADVALKHWLEHRPFKLWGYFPIDAYGLFCGLTDVLAKTVQRYDRAIAYGPFGKGVLERACGPGVAQVPHGIWPMVFRPHPPERSLLTRTGATVTDDDYLLGVVATNQPRKDWGLVFTVLNMLGPRWKLWAHIDKTVSAWSIPALVHDLKLDKQVFVTQGLDDEQLAKLHSSCDVALAPGLGEGFGYPIVEAMACRTPVVHVNYAGGADLLPVRWLVTPKSWRLDGVYGLWRPVLEAGDVANTIREIANAGPPLAKLQGMDAEVLATPYHWPGRLTNDWIKVIRAGL